MGITDNPWVGIITYGLLFYFSVVGLALIYTTIRLVVLSLPTHVARQPCYAR